MKINLEDIDPSELKIAIYFNPNYFEKNYNYFYMKYDYFDVYEKLKNVDFLDVYPKQLPDNFSEFKSIKKQVFTSVINNELCNNINIHPNELNVIMDTGYYQGPQHSSGRYYQHRVEPNDAIITISNRKQNNKIYGFSIINFKDNDFTAGRYKILIPLQCSNKFISVSGIGRKLLNLIQQILNTINSKSIKNLKSSKSIKNLKSSKSIKNKSIKSYKHS